MSLIPTKSNEEFILQLKTSNQLNLKILIFVTFSRDKGHTYLIYLKEVNLGRYVIHPYYIKV